jgi:flavin-dependent dehydrogenase
MELYWGPSCQIYVTPVASNEICVALVSHDQHLRLDAALKAFPEVSNALNGAEPTSVERGAITSTHKLENVYRNNVALVGDASGAVDSITGEGLSLTFRQAQVLAECFVEGDLERYQKEHRALGRRPAMMARLMLALDWKTSFRQRAMRAFNADPRIFNRMLAMHVGELSPVDFAANGLSFGWQLLTA